MIIPYNNSFNISRSPHSVGLQNDVTVPVPYGDNNYFVQRDKAFLSAGMQGLGCNGCPMKGLGCVSCGGSCGGLGDITTIFSDITDMFSNMSLIDWLGIIGIGTAIYFLTGKEQKRRR